MLSHKDSINFQNAALKDNFDTRGHRFWLKQIEEFSYQPFRVSRTKTEGFGGLNKAALGIS